MHQNPRRKAGSFLPAFVVCDVYSVLLLSLRCSGGSLFSCALIISRRRDRARQSHVAVDATDFNRRAACADAR